MKRVSKTVLKFCGWALGFSFISLVFMGAKWQHEIAMLCVTNGWDFGWPFSIIWPNPWQAMDFWELLQLICYGSIIACSVGFGWWIHGILRNMESREMRV